MNILGISAFYHDSAAALIQDGDITAAAQEERFTRKKHDPGFPTEAVKYCLKTGGLTLNQLDAIVFYDKPLLKFERLLETYYQNAPSGVQSFVTAMPVWLKEKFFLKRLIREEFSAIEDIDFKKVKLLFTEHHLSHAASAFYPSPFEEAAVLTIDGVGEWATASIAYGQGKEMKILKELRFPHSVGLLYSAFTYYLGFKVNSGEYKLMGLAPYGNPEGKDTLRYIQLIKDNLVTIREDGSIYLHQEYFNYATGLTMVKEDAWAKLFGVAQRQPESELEQKHCDLGFAIQAVTEEIVIKMAKEAQRLTGSKNLCMAGGVALNCVANGKLLKEKIFEGFYIQPAAGDAGGALGAALAAAHLSLNQPRSRNNYTLIDDMKGSYLGPEYTAQDIELMAKRYKAKFTRYENYQDLADRTAALLSEGNVIGWCQGRMEWGPRSLGNRSILGDPRNEEMQMKLNLKIKYRESFRPFAPVALAEDASTYFDMEGISPYMLLVAPIHPDRRKPLPSDYNALGMKEKLYHLRSDIPSVTHLDFSARIQTAHKETNPRLTGLLQAFKDKTGYGVLVNTSFNVRGEPIVNTPEDAYKCLMRTEMDYLVVGDYLFSKSDQPEWAEKVDWKQQYGLD
jgi:carbamoyltransferase